MDLTDNGQVIFSFNDMSTASSYYNDPDDRTSVILSNALHIPSTEFEQLLIKSLDLKTQVLQIVLGYAALDEY